MKKNKKKIDPFIICSIIVAIFSMWGYSVFAGVWEWGSSRILSEMIHYQRIWAFVMVFAVILMMIGVIRSKVKDNTRNLGFALTLPIVTVESFFAFISWLPLAFLIVVIAYIATYKWWAK